MALGFQKLFLKNWHNISDFSVRSRDEEGTTHLILRNFGSYLVLVLLVTFN